MLEVRSVRKLYDDRAVVNDVTFEVKKGEIFALLGPNGAGKSTTIRALLGLIQVDGGTATVFGMDPWRDAVALHRRLA